MRGIDIDSASGIIARMPQVLADKIAAGEVVQRPASVVKELLENSIDAGARRITVRIHGAGTDSIQVEDDGSGMSAADAELAFERHATSKIRSIEDLESISTLGFRGEALASISAVAQVHLQTKTLQAQFGHSVQVNGGVLATSEPCAFPGGTSITIRNLFYNVPARREFMKSRATESRHIADIFVQIAISHPEICFILESNGVVLYSLPALNLGGASDNLKRRLTDIFGIELGDSLLPFAESTSYLSVSGFVSSPDYYRKSNGEQYLFVNGRSVKSRYLNHAIRGSYEQLIPEKAFPFFALNIHVDPRHVDVNVHPTKQEVKFDDDAGVYAMLRSVAKKTLGQAGFVANPDTVGAKPIVLSEELYHSKRESPPYGASTKTFYDLHHGAAQELPLADDEREMEVAAKDNTPIRQLFDKYIVTTIRSGVILVDQHRAHERVIYEKTIASLTEGMTLSQQLLFPETFELAPAIFQVVESLLPNLNRIGFDLDLFGGRSIVVRGIPESVRASSARTLLLEIISDYNKNDKLIEAPVVDRLARSVAKNCAIRSGERLSEPELRQLLDQLMMCDEPGYTPAGKKIFFILGEEEINERLS